MMYTGRTLTTTLIDRPMMWTMLDPPTLTANCEINLTNLAYLRRLPDFTSDSEATVYLVVAGAAFYTSQSLLTLCVSRTWQRTYSIKFLNHFLAFCSLSLKSTSTYK